jgi:hypothetical protein
MPSSIPGKEKKHRKSWPRRIAKVLLWLVLLPVILVLLVGILVYVPPIQDLIRGKAVAFLQEKTGTNVSLEHFNLRFPAGLTLEGFHIDDLKGDTLLHVGALKADVSLSSIWQKKIVIGSVSLEGGRANISQNRDSVFNFDFLTTAFATPDTVAIEQNIDTTATDAWALVVEEIQLEDLRLKLDLQISQFAADVVIGSFEVGFDEFSMDPLQIHVDEIALEHSYAHLKMVPSSDPPEPDTYPHLENPMKDMDLRFTRLVLDDVEFTMKNRVAGDSLWLSLAELEVNTRKMQMKEQLVEIEDISIDGFHFGQLAMAASIDTIDADTIVKDPPWLDQNDGFRYFIRDWTFQLDELEIANSSVAMHRKVIGAPEKLMDPAHLVFDEIAVDLRSVDLNNDRLALELDRFHAGLGADQPDLQVQLAIDATPQRLRIDDGQLSIGENALAFEATAEPGGLTNVYRSPEKVPLGLAIESELKLSHVLPLIAELTGDPSLLINSDETWTTEIAVNGTIEQLDTIHIHIDGDKGSQLALDASVQHARQWPNSSFKLSLDRLTMGSGFRALAVKKLPAGTDLPSRITMSGSASGSNGSASAVLAMKSDAGNIDLKGSAKGMTQKIPDDIDLDLKVTELATHRFTGDSLLGFVSLELKAEGRQLNSRSRHGTLELRPQKLLYNGIDLSSLVLNGAVQGDSVQVALNVSQDVATVDLKARGHWPDENDSLRAELDLLVDNLELYKLGLMAQPLGVQGHWQGDATFHTNGMGSFDLTGEGVRIFNEASDFFFEEFAAKGHISADSTALELNSDAIDLAYHTNIHPDSLITNSTERLMAIVKDDTSFVVTPGKRMDLTISLPRTEWLTEVLVPDLEVIQLDRFAGSYDSDTDELQLDIHLPTLIYNKIEVDELVVDVTAKDNAINGNISVKRIDQDSIRLEGLSIDATSAGGELTTVLRIADEDQDRYRITTLLRTLDQVRELRVKEDLVMNKKQWTIHGDNVIRFTEGGPDVTNFILTADDQQLEISTPPDHLVMDFRNFELGTFTNIVTTVDSIPLIAADLNGELVLPRNEIARLDADITLNDLHAMGTELGSLRLQAKEGQKDNYDVAARLEHQVNHFDLKASADMSGEKPRFKADGELAFQDLSFLKPFASDLLYELKGALTGDIRIEKSAEDLAMNGKLNFKEAGVGVILTGATYRLPDETITFDQRGIHFKSFALVDSAGNRFVLDGNIDQNADPSPELDLRLRTDRFQFVNSTSEDNKSFYGDLFTRLDLRITGSSKDPDVTGSVGILEGTYMSIVLPGSKVELIDHEGIVVFTDDFDSLDTLSVRTDSEILRDSLAAEMPGIAMDLNIHIAPEATFAVVLDPVTGDAATANAEADLHFKYGHDRDMYLAGPLTIKGGGYQLNFRGLVKKEFELVEGGTITWNGDPTKARLNIKARYISNTPPYALVANASQGLTEGESNRLQQRLPFEVLIGVGGRMDDPDIAFGLDLPRMLRNSYPQVNDRLDQLAQPAFEEERNRQVFALLVLNTFIVDDPGSTPDRGGGFAGSAARNSVNQMLSDQLNKLTGQYVKGVDISLGVNTYDQQSGNSSYQRTSVDYQVSKSLMDDRLTFEVGGSIGVDEQGSDVSNVSSTRRAQYAIMYSLTEDGRYRLRGFHENAFDLYDGEITRSGVAIMYTKEFEENGKARRERRERLKKQKSEQMLKPSEEDEGGNAGSGEQ